MSSDDGEFNWIAIGLIAVVAIVATILIGWQVGWWFKSDAVNREAEINRDSTGAQTVARDQLTRGIASIYAMDSQIAYTQPIVEKEALAAQRHAILSVVCRDATKINGSIPAEQDQFIRDNCQAGGPIPGR